MQPLLLKITLLLMIMVSIMGHAYPPESTTTGYALIIATKQIDAKKIKEKYFNKETDELNYGSLDFVDKDISNIKFVLSKAGFENKNIKTLVGLQIFKAQIENALELLSQKAKKEDLVFIYFTGHGDQVEDKNKDEPDSLDEALVLYNELLIDDEINVMLSKFKAGVKKVLMIDACHSGSTFKLIKSKREFLKEVSNQNFEDEFTKSKKQIFSINNCQIERILPDENKNKLLVYLGASADDQQAKATEQGSYFTSAVTAKFNSRISEWKQFNYQSFACYLRSTVSSSDGNQKVHYMEIGETNFSLSDYPLKIKL